MSSTSTCGGPERGGFAASRPSNESSVATDELITSARSTGNVPHAGGGGNTFPRCRMVTRVTSLNSDRMMHAVKGSSAASAAAGSEGGQQPTQHPEPGRRMHPPPASSASFSFVSRIAHSTSNSSPPWAALGANARLRPGFAHQPLPGVPGVTTILRPHRPSFQSEYERPHSNQPLRPRMLTVGPDAVPSSRSSVDDSRSGLQRFVRQMVLADDAAFKRVQLSLRDITSLAKETSELQMAQDPSGATCMNQYVVIKTLGKGSFGKVKLCLNTLDGQLRAIKMVNRAFVLRQLQKVTKSLRRRPTRSTTVSVHQTSLSQVPEFIQGLEGHKASLDETRWNAGSSLGSPPPPSGPLESVMREIAVLKKLDHPHVVKLFEVIDPPKSSHVLLVMEYMEGGPILETKAQEKFECFSEDVAWNHFRQICQGLDYLHYNCVVHGDLKPENLLVTSLGEVKIADFGSSRIINDASACTKIACTPAFQAPEAVQGGTECDNPYAADIWALGVCLYCFVYGRLPFPGATLMDVSKLILQGVVEYPSDTTPVSPALMDLFSKIFVTNPTSRITLEGIMTHEWTSSNGCMPLPTLKSQLTPPAVVKATRLQTMEAVDHSPLASMIRAKLKEKHYAPGTYLFREFEPAQCVYMIIAGVVEMVATKPVSGPLGVAEDGVESFVVDVDESFTLECGSMVAASAAQVENGKLRIDKAAAEDIKKRMSNLIMGRGQEYVAEMRGPGNVIGEVSFDNKVARHRFSARARDSVVVVILSEDNLMTALKQTYLGDVDSGEGLAFSSHCSNSVQDLLEPVLRSGDISFAQKPTPGMHLNSTGDELAVETL